MQRRINKRLSGALRASAASSQDDVDEEICEEDEEEEEEERPKVRTSRSRSLGSSSRKGTPSSSSKSKLDEKKRPSSKSVRVPSSSAREEAEEDEEREAVTRRPSAKSVRASSSAREETEDDDEREVVTRRPSASEARKSSPTSSRRSFGFGEFRNSRLGAAFLPGLFNGGDENERKEDEEDERRELEDEEDARIPEEEDLAVSPPPEEEVIKKKSRSSKEDVRRKRSSDRTGSATALKDSSSKPKKSSSTKNRPSSSKESLRRSTSKKSTPLPPTFYPQVTKTPSFNGKPQLTSPDYYDDNDDDIVSSAPGSSTTSFTRPLGITSSSVRLPPLYDLRPTCGSYNNQRPRMSSRDVTALPIEIPESVTDEAAFRRYLAVRRGGFVMDPVSFEDGNANVDSASYESVGGGGAGAGGVKLPAQMALMQQTLLAQLEGNKRTMTLSYAIMTLALLSASATQLRFLVAYSKAHAYSLLNYFLVCLCIFIEVVVGLGYVVLSRFTSISEERVESIHNYLISGLFIVAVANVIIAAFAFDDHVCEVLAKQTDLFDSVDQSPQQSAVT